MNIYMTFVKKIQSLSHQEEEEEKKKTFQGMEHKKEKAQDHKIET